MMYQVSSIGITAGAHRLWSHRAYKAKWPLRVILIIFNTIAFQVFFLNNKESEKGINVFFHICYFSNNKTYKLKT